MSAPLIGSAHHLAQERRCGNRHYSLMRPIDGVRREENTSGLRQHMGGAVAYSRRDPDSTLRMQKQRYVLGLKPYGSGNCVQELVVRVVVPRVLYVAFLIEEREDRLG